MLPVQICEWLNLSTGLTAPDGQLLPNRLKVSYFVFPNRLFSGVNRYFLTQSFPSMAKVIFGNGVSEISGKIAGNVFSRNANGSFIRNRVNPINPQTSKQLAVRAGLSAISTGWRNLTDGQRDAWATAAPTFPYTDGLGQRKVYTGQQLFMKFNQALVQAGQTQITSPPSPATIPDFLLDSLDIELAMGVLDIVDLTFSAASIPAGWVLQVFMTPGLSSGIMRPQKGLFRLIGTYTSITSSVLNAKVLYNTLFGVPAVGAKVFARVVATNTTTGQQVDIGQQSADVV